MMITIQSANLAEAALYNDYQIPPLQQTLEHLQSEYQTHQILTATAEKRIVGSVRAHSDGGVCYIGRLIVHPEFQHQGIGSRLLQTIEEQISSPIYELFTGSRSENNLKLYMRRGYKEARRTQVSPALELIFLQKHMSL